MATNFPTSLDALTNPTGASGLTSPDHAGQHSDINDAMEAVQTKLGIGNTVLGTYTAFTPSLGNWSIGNGTIDAKYCRVNDFVHYFGVITAGSTTTFSAELYYSMPIHQDGTSNRPLGTCYTRDASSGIMYAGVVRALGTNTAYATGHTADYTYIRMRTIETTSPFTLTTGDQHYFNLYYKAA